jgi:hypothetical protein
MKSQPKDDEFIILYNKWVESESYRRDISRQLFGTYQGHSLATISDYGGGSSFQVKKRFHSVLHSQKPPRNGQKS